jgi:hypothetical protein
LVHLVLEAHRLLLVL